jgi:uncharacterized ion transporter superfamily protein YfcC
MAFNLKNRSFLKEIDFTPRELRHFLKLAEALKLAKYAGTETRLLAGQEIALIFEKGTVTGIISGAGDFIGAALIIAVARGVTVIMNNASITDTVLHALEGAVSGLSSGAFAVVMYLVNIPLAFLVPSSSGHATLAMPIMAPLGDFAGVSRAMVVTAYQSASGWMNLFTSTSAIVMGGLALSRVRYDRYLRFVAPLLGILLVLTCLAMLLGVAVPALGGSVK